MGSSDHGASASPSLRIVFAGTPEFACPALRALIDHTPPVAILTQPDRPAGRGRRVRPGPVRQVALDAGIDVLQPKTLRDDDAFDTLAALAPELIVTAAYGLLLPPRVLALPVLGCWNLHASLLPRWRGASPIQQAILAGDRRSGITLMQMDAGMDTGDVLLSQPLEIAPDETAASLHDRLADAAATLLIDALDRLAAGSLPAPQPQDESGATRAPRIDKRDAELDWRRPAIELERRVRGYNPWPVAHGTLAGAPVRIFAARAGDGDTGLAPGTLVRDRRDAIRVACGEGVLEILELQAPGRRRLSAAEWLNAHPDWRA